MNYIINENSFLIIKISVSLHPVKTIIVQNFTLYIIF